MLTPFNASLHLNSNCCAPLFRAMAAEGAEEVVSLQDVLEEDRQLEQTANAVLGDSDDSHCTYPKVHYHSLLCISKSL